jgi:predicted nucleic acid-binding protein
MTFTRHLLDTNILIDYIKGIPAAVTLVDGLPEPVLISIVTHIELLVNARNDSEEEGILEFLQDFEVVELDAAVVLETARFKRHILQHTKKTKVQMPDLIIRASASVREAVIYTLNKKDFPPGEGVVYPYESVANTDPSMRQQAAAAVSAAAALPGKNKP